MRESNLSLWTPAESGGSNKEEEEEEEEEG